MKARANDIASRPGGPFIGFSETTGILFQVDGNRLRDVIVIAYL